MPKTLAEAPADSAAPSVGGPTLGDAPPDAPATAAGPPILGAAPATAQRNTRPSGSPPWRAAPPTPAEFAAPSPELAATSAPGAPTAKDDGPLAADASDVVPDDAAPEDVVPDDVLPDDVLPDEVGVDTDPLHKIVAGGRDNGDAVASDVPDVELSDTEVAEVLSGRVIPIGAFFGGTQAHAGQTDHEAADAAGATFLDDLSRALARWAKDRSLGVTSASGIGIALAICAAAWFSAGTRGDIIRGVLALWAGYLVLRAGQWLVAQADQADVEQQATQANAGLIAGGSPETSAGAISSDPHEAARATHRRTARRRTRSMELRGHGPVAWLAALGGAAAESGVYAGLAAGAVAERWAGVWTLATAVVSLVAVRNLMTACSTPPGLSEQSGGGTFRRLAAAVLTMPVGGRVLAVGIVAPFWGARAALLVLLDWAIISIGYGIAGRAAARMIPRTAQDSQSGQVAARSKLVRLRDDGALARLVGVLVRGNLMPLPPALLGLAAVSGLAFVGLHGLPGALLIAPAVVMLLAAPGSANPHTGRFDWLVPVLLLGAQCLYLTATGLAVRVPGPVIFALIAAIMIRYTDLAWPGRPVHFARRRDPGAEPLERGTAFGWEGRMLLAGLTAATGVATFAYIGLTAYIVALICLKAVTSCFAPSRDTLARDRPSP